VAQARKTRIQRGRLHRTVSIPVNFLQRRGRKQILSPAGAAPWSRAARLTAPWSGRRPRHRWRQMLESREYTSSAELAKTEKVNDSYGAASCG